MHNRHRTLIAVLGIVALLVLGIWLRWPALSTGLPYLYYEDEAHHLNRTLEMVKKGEFNPRYFHKPSLHFYLRMPAAVAGFFWNVRNGHIKKVKEIETRDPFGIGGYAFTASHPGIVKWVRSVSLILALGTLIITYALSKAIIRSPISGLVGATIAACSPLLLEYSAAIGVDIVMTFFAVLATLFAAQFIRSPNWQDLIICSLAAGLSVSSKYNALPALIVPLAAYLVSCWKNSRALITALVLPPLGFLIGSPFILSELPLFMDQFAYEIWHYGVAGHMGHSSEPGLPQLTFYLTYLASSGVGAAALATALVGVVIFSIQKPRVALVVLAFPVLYLLLMVFQKVNFTRNMLPLVPYVAFLSAYTLREACGHSIFRRLRPKLALPILLAITAAQPLWQALSVRDSLIDVEESRVEADAWLASQGDQSLHETAIAGSLQFPPATYRRRQSTRVDLEKRSPQELIQSGYSRVVAPAAFSPSAESAELMESIQSFAGETEEQRIVQNPAITIYQFAPSLEHDLQVMSGLLKSPADHLLFRLYLVGDRELRIGDELEAFCGRGAISPEEPFEGHCWTSKRVEFVRLVDAVPLRDLSEQSSADLNLELTSPWPEQSLKIRSGAVEVPIWLGEHKPFEWFSTRVSLPANSLKADGGFYITTSIIRSPKSFGLSSDERRLGVALRRIELNL